MFDLEKLHEELLRDEGLRLDAYKDTQGYWTIGIGHLLGKTKRITRITVPEAYAFLSIDIDNAVMTAKSCVPLFNALDDVRQRALINMAFNRGQNMKTSSTITPAINKATLTEDWSLVSAAGINSEWASQVGMRATRLLNMLTTGTVI